MTSLSIRAAFVWVLLLAPNATEAESRYVIDLADSGSGILNVSLETDCSALPCDFQLPAWSATYQIRNFSQHLSNVVATKGDGEEIDIRKVGPSRWRIATQGAGLVRLRYSVRADRDGPFGSQVQSDRVTLNLAQVLIYPEAERQATAFLRFAGLPRGFRQALALPVSGDGYSAPSYDRLVDTPVLLADFVDDVFDIAGKPIRIVVNGPGAGRRISGLRGTARKIVKSAIELMGEASFDGYTFVYVFAQAPGGGMEYRDGTLIFGPPDCPTCGLDELTAHEFFHRWNVKRIRAASMEPVDYSRPVPSPSLWFAEGVSSTYARYLLAAAGLTTERDMLSRLEERINQYESRSAHLTQSAEESSIDAWLEGDSAYNRPDRSVSYYLKGELIGYLLDLEIRGRTENQRSLDDVIRGLDRDYAQKDRLFEDTATLTEIASDIAGSDMTPVFDELVRTAAPINWDHYLGRAGLHLERITRSWRDSGMNLASPPGQGVVVAAITPGGAAEKAGVRVGDRLLEMDDQRVVGSAEAVLTQLHETARPTSLTIERNGFPIAVRLSSGDRVETVRKVVSLSQVTAMQRVVRNGWLTRRTVKDFGHD